MKKVSLCALTMLVLTLASFGATNVSTQFQPVTGKAKAAQATASTLAAPRPGEGDPAPTCYPGKTCGNQDSLRVIAGEGDPAPTCYPGKTCGNQDKVRVLAGEGDPAPTCYPGKTCGNQDSLRVIAGEGDPAPTCYPVRPAATRIRCA